MPTTAGSVALERSIPDRDSPVVAKLRAAGAILLGKLNLSEFANFLTNGMPSGYSSLGGQVLNPYNADITPSGSSSGSGAAAAAGLAAITIGTETSGSIVSPSAAQGIVGLRPTIGLVSRTGILPISATQDTAGPMTRTVADAAAELGAIAGKDPEDPGHGRRARDRPGLPRRAVADRAGRQADRRHQQHQRAVRRRGRRRPGAGRDDGDGGHAAGRGTGDILTPEFKRDLNAYLSRLPANAPMKSLADIIAYNTANAADATKFGQTQLTASQATDLTDPAQNAAYVTARDTGRRNAQNAIDNGLNRGTADPADDVEAIMTPSGTLTGLGARAGYPQLVVPAGYAAGDARPGRDRVQRHGLQRGQAARVRLRLRAGDVAAQAAERDQPEPVALRRGQRVRRDHARVRAQHAGQRRRRLDAGRRHGAGDALAHARRERVLRRLPAGRHARVHGVDHGQRDLHGGRRGADGRRPGRLMNGSFSLPQPLRVEIDPASWTQPVSNAAGGDHVPPGDRRHRRPSDGYVQPDADVHALDHRAVNPPLIHLHARRMCGRGAVG